MDNRPYEINRVHISLEEKKQRFEDYKSMQEAFGLPLDVDKTEFLSRDIYDESVTLLCNRCKKEATIDLEILDEFGFDEDEIPSMYCQYCSKGTMRPKFLKK